MAGAPARTGRGAHPVTAPDQAPRLAVVRATLPVIALRAAPAAGTRSTDVPVVCAFGGAISRTF